jgi:hypothetical protein
VNGEDYVSLSRMLGRNAAYIQQFIRRRTPCKLDAEDRRTLARYLRIDEALLGGPRAIVIAKPQPRRDADFVRIPRRAVGASAGPGPPDAEDAAAGEFVLDARSVRAWRRRHVVDDRGQRRFDGAAAGRWRRHID